MKPETTWKEEFDKRFASTEHVDEIAGAVSRETIKSFVESLLSSSQALARRSGIEEAMRVVEEMKAQRHVLGTSDLHLIVREETLQALQEMVDTKA